MRAQRGCCEGSEKAFLGLDGDRRGPGPARPGRELISVLNLSLLKSHFGKFGANLKWGGYYSQVEVTGRIPDEKLPIQKSSLWTSRFLSPIRDEFGQPSTPERSFVASGFAL